jgi:asparagine N-glycosylation enzyme membrane subunit Stt3
MQWVREETPKDSLFVHWWDYGYWVQTRGKRSTVSDGGQIQSRFQGNEKIGRYVLTTPYPETAKSFMKTFGVDYLLIDPTEIGKYAAYSSIGDGDEISDRESYLVSFISSPQEIQETKDSIIRFYRGGIALDSDIYYEKENDSSRNIYL